MENPSLFNRFLFQPAFYIHPGYKPVLAGRGISEALVEQIWRKPALSRRIFNCFGLDFSAIRKIEKGPEAVILMGYEALEKLCLYTGLAFFGPSLARTIDGAFLRQLETTVGGEALDFARHHRFSPKGVLPSDPPKDPQAIIRTGFRFISHSLRTVEKQYRLRFNLKFPPTFLKQQDSIQPANFDVFWPEIAVEMIPECRSFIE